MVELATYGYKLIAAPGFHLKKLDYDGQLQLKLLAHMTKYEQSKDVCQNDTENKTQKS
ncbi:MAG: hypothetical protein LW635_15470 [Microcystis sp. 53598_E5]|nr:hypothetical protein [Microcystis sp. 53598_E5]